MKKFLSILMTVLVIGACATTQVDAKKRTKRKAKTTRTTKSRSFLQPGYYRIVGESNVRTGPGENYPVMYSLPNHMLVYVQFMQGNWCYISVGQGIGDGWTHRDNLRRTSNEDSQYSEY